MLLFLLFSPFFGHSEFVVYPQGCPINDWEHRTQRQSISWNLNTSWAMKRHSADCTSICCADNPFTWTYIRLRLQIQLWAHHTWYSIDTELWACIRTCYRKCCNGHVTECYSINQSKTAGKMKQNKKAKRKNDCFTANLFLFIIFFLWKHFTFWIGERATLTNKKTLIYNN